MRHEITVAVNIDEDKLQEKVTNDAAKAINELISEQAVERINKTIEETLFASEERVYNRKKCEYETVKTMSEFVKNIVEESISRICDEHAEEIIIKAAERTSVEIRLSTLWKEWLARVKYGIETYKATSDITKELVSLKKKYGSNPELSGFFKAVDEAIEKVRNEEANNAE